MIISGIFGKSNISKIDIEVEFPHEIYANRPFPLKVRIVNKRKLLSGFLFRLYLEGEEALFPYVSVRSGAVEFVTFTIGSRGLHTIDDIHVCSVFPFNFFVRCIKIRKSFDVIVFPEPLVCDIYEEFKEDVKKAGESSHDRTGYHPEMLSIRDYIHGDPLKYINWKATAKTDKLKTKELSSAAVRPVVIDLDETGIRGIEERVSCVTHLVLQLYKRGVPFGLKIGKNIIPPQSTVSQRQRVLKELALYDA